MLRLSSALSIRVHTPPYLNNCPQQRHVHMHTYTLLTTWVLLLAELGNISLISGSKHEARPEKSPRNDAIGTFYRLFDINGNPTNVGS